MDDYREELVKRIADCQSVLGGVKNNAAWNVVMRDLEREKQRIDDHWHLVAEDSVKLKELRVTKMAVMHLLNLVGKYELDLKSAQDELQKYENPGEEIMKDYDTE